MTLKEQIYRFENLGIHEAIIIQKSIENRKRESTQEGDPLTKRGEKEIKAVLDELDQFHDDLSRHIAAEIRKQEDVPVK